MPRKQHTYHFIYKTTNTINDKFYIGMHSTSNLEDGYIGSGKYLWNAIRKYGRENFLFEILEWYDDKESLKNREIELVNEDLLLEPKCMNIRLGGGGIQKGSKLSEETKLKISRNSGSHRQEVRDKISNSCKGKAGKYVKSEEHKRKLADANTGKVQNEDTKLKRAESLKITYTEKGGHSEESRQKMSSNRKGKGIGNPGRKGQPHSAESNRKNSESHKGKVVSEETKKKISEFWEKRRLEKLQIKEENENDTIISS